ncbi:hypothetical protein ACFLX5_04945 [Chloroflexota bacterium]
MKISISGRLLLVLSSVLLLLGACRVPDDSYKTMNVRSNIANFSFEYRTYYQDVEGPEVFGNDSIYVHIMAPKRKMSFPNPEPGINPDTLPLEYVPAYIGVAVFPNIPGSSAAKRIEAALSSEARWPDYKLLERSAVTVDGIRGELVAYQTNQISGPPVVYMANVYLDYGVFTWAFDVVADFDLAETVRADFYHVLRMFKVLK